MKVSCSKIFLNNVLSHLIRIIPAHPAHPILGCFMIFTRDNTLVLQATDLELSLMLAIPAQVESEGCIVVAGRHLTELVRRLPEGEVILSLDDDLQQLDILYGSASVHINTWAAAEFPALPAVPSQNRIVMEGAKWKNIHKKVVIAAAPQEVRPNYAGVYIQIQPEKIKLVATDTYRLALLSTPFQCDLPDTALFVPARPLGEVMRVLDDEQQVNIFWDQAIIGFQTETFALTARLMDAQFPNYEKVIPGDFQLRIRMSRELFNNTLERASLFNEPPMPAVVDLKVEGGKLLISAHAQQYGSLKEEIILSGIEGEEGEASFTTRYLLDPLRVMDREEVLLCLNGPREPAVYLEEGEEFYLHLVLPVRRISDNMAGAGP